MSKHVSMFVHSLTDHIDEIDIANANFHEISQHMNENINFIRRENIVNIKTLKKFFETSDAGALVTGGIDSKSAAIFNGLPTMLITGVNEGVREFAARYFEEYMHGTPSCCERY